MNTFAEAVNNIYDILISQLPQPVINGDIMVITIPEDEYQAEFEGCKHNLHARIIWSKGTTPLKLVPYVGTFWENRALLILVKDAMNYPFHP
ncbi:unnamed protein product [Lathyrus sativus]|nr:unnamed protein product [Lathyrus sativus]